MLHSFHNSDSRRTIPLAPTPEGALRAGDDASLDFLTETSRRLGDAFLGSTLTTAAGLALPLLGTWCIVDVVDATGVMRRLTVLHPDAARQQLARNHFEAHPPFEDEQIGVARMMTEAAEVVQPEAQRLLSRIAQAETRALISELGASALLVVAMRLGGQTLGAITFGSAEPRSYEASDIAIAEDLGRRCAFTVDCARSYGEMQIARIRAEHAFAMEDAARAEFEFARGRRTKTSGRND
jgi:hypothetical protein